MFDFVRFFDSNGIGYATSGANVSRGNVAIHCPFCGPADEGQHMSVSTEGKGWRCWRSVDHRGKSPARLVAALLRVSFEQAAQITGEQIDVPDDFLARVRGNIMPSADKPERELKLLPEFKRFEGKPSSKPFMRYMADRYYDSADVARLSRIYGLRYATQGYFRGRIIFPVKQGGKLVSWTGRSIYPTASLRYMSLPWDDEKAREHDLPPAVGPISEYLLWGDKLKHGGDVLVLCEGPFDALRIDFHGKAYGIRATCCFTAAPSRSQIEALHELAPLYDRRLIMFDHNAYHTAMRVRDMIAPLGFDIARLPPHTKDPGAIKPERLPDFLIALAA